MTVYYYLDGEDNHQTAYFDSEEQYEQWLDENDNVNVVKVKY